MTRNEVYTTNKKKILKAFPAITVSVLLALPVYIAKLITNLGC